MIEPTMKAIPARKKSRSTTSTAAATLSTKPVSEIVFGVRRDSISRSRISVELGVGALAARAGAACAVRCEPAGRLGLLCHGDQADARGARFLERPDMRPGPGKQPSASSA